MLKPDVGWFQHQRLELKTRPPTVACNGGDAYTAVQLMEGCNYADAMEVQRGVDAITTRGLVFMVWWIMPLRGKVPREKLDKLDA